MSDEPKRRVSGTIAAQQYRVKYDSVSENTIPLVDALNSRLDAALNKAKKSTPPAGLEAVDPEVPLVQLDSHPDSDTPVRVRVDVDAAPDTLPAAKDPRREPDSDKRREPITPIDEVRIPRVPRPAPKKGT